MLIDELREVTEDDTPLERRIATARPEIASILERSLAGEELSTDDGLQLLATTGADLHALIRTADHVRAVDVGPEHVAIVSALGQVDPDHREVVVLHYLADLGTAAIAEELGIPEGTVKSRLSRARARLAPLLDESEEVRHG